MDTLEAYFPRLNDLLQSPCAVDEVKKLGQLPFLEEHELAHAVYALLLKRANLRSIPLELNPQPNGAIPLFRRGFFPWGALPYPREHAQLGSILAQLEKRKYQEMAYKMALFQQATLDHQKRPLHAFFSQEKGCLYSELEAANRAFFEQISFPIADTLNFVDPDLGIVARRLLDRTTVCFGSGCKSGMGIFLVRDAGIVNFGPQQLPLGNCQGFGLAGRAKQVHYKEKEEGYSFSFQSRVAAPHSRKTGFAGLEDSGYSALWIEAEIEAQRDSLALMCSFEGFCPLSSIAFSFFGRGKACYVAGSHKLNPRSLDRYQGPPQRIELKGEQGSVYIEAQEGLSQMEVIPLAGDESFWQADFLIAYFLNLSRIRFVLR